MALINLVDKNFLKSNIKEKNQQGGKTRKRAY